MIKAKHNIFAESIYRIYVKWLLKFNFNKFILINEIPDVTNCKGLIVTPNHFSWWDGFFIEYLMRKFTKRKLFIMMLEKQLKRFWFFKYLGAFSIRQKSIFSLSETIKYARTILTSSFSYLVFYPQGEIQNYEKKFIKLKRGLIAVTSDIECSVLIVSFKIIYRADKKPDVYCRFGEEPILNLSKDDFVCYERLFLKNIEQLDEEISNKNGIDLLTEK
ncbi:MAG: lysophospholipid acyltransferase family protein [Bacteroidota bacterium]|nr:lysophospholipid acyltransferase family protein [Bacteroidota bacterium]